MQRLGLRKCYSLCFEISSAVQDGLGSKVKGGEWDSLSGNPQHPTLNPKSQTLNS